MSPEFILVTEIVPFSDAAKRWPPESVDMAWATLTD
jgi:hypothetical protein